MQEQYRRLHSRWLDLEIGIESLGVAASGDPYIALQCRTTILNYGHLDRIRTNGVEVDLDKLPIAFSLWRRSGMPESALVYQAPAKATEYHDASPASVHGWVNLSDGAFDSVLSAALHGCRKGELSLTLKSSKGSDETRWDVDDEEVLAIAAASVDMAFPAAERQREDNAVHATLIQLQEALSRIQEQLSTGVRVRLF